MFKVRNFYMFLLLFASGPMAFAMQNKPQKGSVDLKDVLNISTDWRCYNIYRTVDVPKGRPMHWAQAERFQKVCPVIDDQGVISSYKLLIYNEYDEIIGHFTIPYDEYLEVEELYKKMHGL